MGLKDLQNRCGEVKLAVIEVGSTVFIVVAVVLLVIYEAVELLHFLFLRAHLCGTVA